jgi:outer membrane lipoprotein SlyB
MTATEKFKAGMQGILSGAGGSKEGQMIGEAVGQGIKNLFGQGKKDGAGGTQVGPGRLGPNATEAAQAGGPIIGGHREQGARQEAGGLDVGGSLGKKVGGMLGSALGGEKGKTVGQMLGKAVGNVAGQAADLAVDHARGIGGGIGSAIGGAVAGEKGAAVGKDLGKNIGSGVKSVRDTLAGQGVELGPKQAAGKQGHGIK